MSQKEKKKNSRIIPIMAEREIWCNMDLYMYKWKLVRLTDSRGDASHWTRAWDVSRHRSRLRSRRSLSRRCLLLHLPMTLTQIKHLQTQNTDIQQWWRCCEDICWITVEWGIPAAALHTLC